jgi:hypothetical protein
MKNHTANTFPKHHSTPSGKKRRYLRPAYLSLAALLATPAFAADKPASWKLFDKPAWLTDLSIGVKESYDNNVFLSGVDEQFLPSTYTVVPGSAVALKEKASWVTTISPKVGFNFAPLLGSNSAIQAIAVGYSPDFSFYHNQSSENFSVHRLATVLKGQTGNFSFNLDNAVNYIDGSKQGPTYPGGLLSAFGIVAPRERREQYQDRAKVTLRYDWEKVFIRPIATLLYYDLRTDLRNVSGYLNCPDRYDVNGGADLGYKINPQLAVFAGYRYGHQYQQQFSFSPYSSPSDYHRALIGIEGKPFSWLKVEICGGPEFRVYEADSATHITPVNDKHPTKYYGEAALTADITKADSVTFKYRQFQWVSSTGRIPYFDSLYDLSYRHKFLSQIALDLGARAAGADYASANLAPSNLRNDWQYTLSAGVSYALNANFGLNLAYNLDLGRNEQEGIANPQTREYNRSLFSFGAQYKF